LSFNISEWTRIIHNDIPIYLRPESPDWFVPTPAGDTILSNLFADKPTKLSLEEQRFLRRLPDADKTVYPGRYELLNTDTLRELWFHITDNCNMSCTHCLFSSSPDANREMATERVLELTAQAEQLGCKMFAVTGGEPLVHKGLPEILNRMLAIESSHVAVLTNGLAVKKFFSAHSYDFNRLHLQISIDGIGDTHDKLRGKGMFAALEKSLGWLSARGIPFTLSMCVTKDNVSQIKEVVEFAARTGASNVHFMWYFVRGRGESQQFVKPEEIYPHLLEAWETGERTGVTIDNVEAVKSMIFAPCGTVHDGSTAGWESLAVGPDGNIYPSAATVGIDQLATGINGDLKQAWKKSPVLESLRKSSGKNLATPFKLILGGGDTDHSYMHKQSFLGDDPYSTIYEKLALELITRKANESEANETPQLRLKMGDKLDRCSGHGAVALTHTNCLLAVAGNNSLAVVKDFYTEAADTAKEDILNPACYDPALMAHIPEKYRFRGYGCGSPVMDAGIVEGEHVVDLGSGRGIECFIAAKQVGPEGKVTGIDMLDPMLDHAREGQASVAKNLGYDNMDFRKGYLETLPLDENAADLLLSNCVLNLSTDKRRTFAEMFRVLKPGGRLTISDVVCETEPGPEIRNDDTLHGECIAGAQTQKNLCGLLEEAGFESLLMVKRFPYRTVGGHQFFSLTFSARKPYEDEKVKAVYRGPLETAITASGKILTPGTVAELPKQEAELLGEQLFIINKDGAVDNIFVGESCCCPTPDAFDKTEPEVKSSRHANISLKNMEGCMVCGEELEYLTEYREMACSFCGENNEANAHCTNGHFVCDKCHSEDGMTVLPHLLKSSTETDMITLMIKARNHPSIPMHGPEHHALVPGVIVTAYRNSGGAIDDRVIDTAISRGAKVAGGFCGFMGICGAAIGVGTAMSAILEATPLTALQRSIAQKGTLAALELIADIEAARCCQRDCWLALKAASKVSEDVLGLRLKADAHILCDQMKTNKECMGGSCPVVKNSKGKQQPVMQLLGSIANSEKKV